jgi:glycosyltransferase involved in cell wall biosynthesis
MMLRDFIIFSTADWDEPTWTNKQHVAMNLGNSGHRVLYIESVGLRAPTISSGRDIKRMYRRLVKSLRGAVNVVENVWVYSPLVIPFKHNNIIVRSINRIIIRLYVSYFIMKKRFRNAIIWTYHPFISGTIPARLNSKIVYHCVDDLSEIPGINKVAFKKEERKLLEKCRIVFATSPALRDDCKKYNENTHFYPNVVSVEHFSKSRDLPVAKAFDDIPGPRLGYIGYISDFKLDFSLLLSCVKARPDLNWVFIGEVGAENTLLSEIQELPNTNFLGHVGYDDLPSYVAGLDVGLLPTLLNQYTRSMFPMKYFEYLASGLPVVATPLDFTQEFTDGLEIGCDTKSFLRAIDVQLARGHINKDDSESFVGSNTWSERQASMLNQIDF